ncbi:hypothetical protein VNI00_010984 [Paramarasmius palmivorus]|uniref:Uncharacterized protein n=1 Tax=Paramarasmius palmivorus TaxID=297713 RepID=A0AAW0CEV0_9AGAR
MAKPMSISKNQALMTMLQDVMNLTCPDHPHTVRMDGDAIFHVGYDRLKEMQSNIGSEAWGLVYALFQKPEYVENANAALEYARFSLRRDGPLLYKTPTATPQLPSNSPNYKYPDGIFESDIVVQMMRKLLTMYKTSHKTDHPTGGLALVMTALDRAFLACERKGGVMPTGPESKSDQFGQAQYGALIDEYMCTIQRLSNNHWQHLLTLYGHPTPEAQPQPDTIQLVNHSRSDLFIPFKD